ncbi:hypothetical protein BB559_001182 [Furculomyces boomerangus]|uniref:Globin-sensor domain-containing protein n=1 Tax=Furculomyces boomerangus TaxID=61424 RepID=A0A2T9Z2T4_9FUNG|nr:hypothetical protein BB559_001182 [Furculomyces boomerangus]
MADFIHIDRDRLYTDLQYRFEYVAGFIGFDEKDRQLIRDSAPIVEPLIPKIVDAFYEKIFSYDAVKVFMTKPMSGIEDNSETMETIRLDSSPILYRKMMLKKYFNRILTADWDTAHIRYLDWVARIHPLSPVEGASIGVNYVHVNSMIGYLAGLFTDVLTRINEWDEETKCNTVIAFNKFFYVQADLFSRYYVKEGVAEIEKEAIEEAKKQEMEEIRQRVGTESHPVLMTFALIGLVLGSVTARILYK